MTLTLRAIAQLVGGQLHGDGERVVTGAAILRDALPGEITLAEGDKAAKQLALSSASAVIIGKLPVIPSIPYIQVENLHAAFAKVVEQFRPQRPRAAAGIHPTARVSATAQVADDVVIGAGATIGEDVEIAAGCVIHAHVVVGDGSKIGAHTTIYPQAVLYEDTVIGQHCVIHGGAVIGAFGFGYSVVHGRHQLSAQLGYVVLGDHVEVGANTTIDRGTYGATTIGEGTKIDNQVQIAHNCRIGKHNLICSQVGIAGSATTGDYVVMAGQVGVRDHVQIADGVRLGAKAGVINDIAAPGGAYVGAPTMPEREYFQSLFGFAKLPEMRKTMKQLERDVAQLKSLAAPSVAGAATIQRSEAA